MTMGGFGLAEDRRLMTALLRALHRLHVCRIGWQGGAGNEEVVVVEVAIHASGDLGGLGTEGGASALQEDYDDDSPYVCLGIGREPSIPCACLRAGSSLAQNLFF